MKKTVTFISIALISVLPMSVVAKDQDRGDREQRHERRGPPPFEELDLNEDGVISLEEFEQHEVPRGDHATIFAAIDSDDDGAITSEELSSHKPPRREGKKSKH